MRLAWFLSPWNDSYEQSLFPALRSSLAAVQEPHVKSEILAVRLPPDQAPPSLPHISHATGYCIAAPQR